jgi:signal transduction histidine kinase
VDQVCDAATRSLTPVTRLPSEPSGSPANVLHAPAAPIDDPGFSVGRFKVEAAGLVLLLATFAIIQFQDLFTSRTISLTPTNVARYEPYWYDDKGNGGNSTVSPVARRPLSWSCDLGPAYAYPFCGYGLLFDKGGSGLGLDLSDFQHARIKLAYSGSATKIRLSLKNDDPRYKAAGAKPNEIEVAVRQGEQTVEVPLDELAVADWWATQNHLDKKLAQPQRDSVSALEIQPGTGAKPGHHVFSVEQIAIEGKTMSQAQFYLVLLVLWAMLIAGFLVTRVLRIRRKFESRHARQEREARELQFARAVAERSSAAKSAFLANMSHELRTPLNAILGYAQLLEQGGLGERDHAAARTIRQSGTHLLTLITDILDLSKIEAGRLELDPAQFDLHACVTGVGDMMRIRASEKGLGFSTTVDAAVPQRAISDEKRLRQVLINLIGNAIKFTHQGEVSLRVSAGDAPPGRHAVRIEVRDTGVGMREEELARVFEPFEQAGKTGQRAGGTGLGLSISRQIVALMGGQIHVASSEGQGSRFWFDILLEPAEPMLERPQAVALPAPGETKAAAAQSLAPLPAEQLDTLLTLARAGNMRAIRAYAEALSARDPAHAPFAERLTALAGAYQSRAILELVSSCADKKEAA